MNIYSSPPTPPAHDFTMSLAIAHGNITTVSHFVQCGDVTLTSSVSLRTTESADLLCQSRASIFSPLSQFSRPGRKMGNREWEAGPGTKSGRVGSEGWGARRRVGVPECSDVGRASRLRCSSASPVSRRSLQPHGDPASHFVHTHGTTMEHN